MLMLIQYLFFVLYKGEQNNSTKGRVIHVLWLLLPRLASSLIEREESETSDNDKKTNHIIFGGYGGALMITALNTWREIVAR